MQIVAGIVLISDLHPAFEFNLGVEGGMEQN
jgi:hypothetical protein